MVAKMCDILASFFAWRRRDHRLLRVTESASEHVQRSDMVGVPSVVARDALKALSSSVFGRHQSTLRACAGRVARIDFNKTNTVLLCELLDPRKRVPICPWRGRLAKFLAAVFLLAGLQSVQILHANDGQAIPGQLLNRPVDVALTRRPSAPLPLASGLTMPDALTDSLDLGSVVRPLGINQQLVDADVYGELRTAFPWLGVWNLDPQRSPSIAEFASLEELRSRLAEPVQQSLVSLEWNDYRITLNESRNLQCIVEAPVATFNLGNQGTQADGFADARLTGTHTERLCGLLRRDDLFKGHLQAVGSMAVRQAAARNAAHRLGIKPASPKPEGIDVSLSAATCFATQRFDPPALRGGHQFQGYFDGSDHLWNLGQFDTTVHARSMAQNVTEVKD